MPQKIFPNFDGKTTTFWKLVGFQPSEPQPIIITDLKRILKDGRTEKIAGKLFFNIYTIGESRIEVSAGYSEDAFPYFCEMLLKIASTFSEAGERIVHYVESSLHRIEGSQSAASKTESVEQSASQSRNRERKFAPKREGDYQMQRAFWQKIRHLVMAGKSPKEIHSEINGNDPKFKSLHKYGIDTLRKIIKAGNNGEFGDETS